MIGCRVQFDDSELSRNSIQLNVINKIIYLLILHSTIYIYDDGNNVILSQKVDSIFSWLLSLLVKLLKFSLDSYNSLVGSGSIYNKISQQTTVNIYIPIDSCNA